MIPDVASFSILKAMICFTRKIINCSWPVECACRLTEVNINLDRQAPQMGLPIKGAPDTTIFLILDNSFINHIKTGFLFISSQETSFPENKHRIN